jgi:xanthine/CO dehydrogenase XdhC/CoxF family maturation factor
VESSLGALLPLLSRERAAGRSTALAVLLRTVGSTYQRPGALLLIASSGEYAGLLSGGCLEGDLAERARAVIESGRAQRVTYDLRDPNDLVWGLGTGCEGAMHVLLLRVGPLEHWQPLAHFAEALAAHTPTAAGLIAESLDTTAALGTVILPGEAAGGMLTAAARDVLEASRRASEPAWLDEPGRYKLFLLPLALPPRVLLLGAGPDTPPVARMAAELYWKVTVVDHRSALLLPERFPAVERLVHTRPEKLLDCVQIMGFDAAVVMTHQLEMDRDYLRVLARSALPYVGRLGPPARAERLLGELGADADALRERLHAPVGLNLGGRSPAAIAVSIVAQILAFLHGRLGGCAPAGQSRSAVR